MTRKRTNAALVTDNEVTNNLARVNPEVFEDSDVRDYLELFANDDMSEEVLEAADVELGDEEIKSAITDEDFARLDALLKQQVRPSSSCSSVRGPWRAGLPSEGVAEARGGSGQDVLQACKWSTLR